jgi:hypothetical protein
MRMQMLAPRGQFLVQFGCQDRHLSDCVSAAGSITE